MSSNSKSSDAKEEATPALVPKLRFPEFRGTEGWVSRAMGEVYSFKSNNSLSRDQLNYDHGSIKNIHYGDIHTKLSTLFDITKETLPFINPSEWLDGFRADNDCVERDMIFADASEDLADIGKSIEIIRLNGERVVSGQHTILARPNDDSLAISFGAYLFKSSYVRTQIQKESQGSKVLGISAARLAKIKLPIPSTKPEQQKISDCLSSVDELIAAQARKVDALKTHKKGLMQQLFPREGETQPRLRFPEFQNAGEWEVRRLKQLATYTKGFAFKSQDYKERGVRIIRVSDLGADFIKSDNEKIYLDADSAIDHARYKLSQGEIIITTVGSKPELVDSAVGRGILVSKPNEGLLNQNLLKLEMLPDTDSRFLFCNINTALYQKFIVSISRGNANQANIAVKELMDFELKVPSSAEQQRIATCLSSLDALITAETQKHEALKTHKKGLMQQLFPFHEEVV